MFKFTLDHHQGLRAVSWENRMLGTILDLSMGSEFELDLDEAMSRLWVTGWKVRDTDLEGSDPDQETGYLKELYKSEYDDTQWEGCQTPAMIDAFHYHQNRYRWARTYLYIPEHCKDQEMTLVLGGFGLLDFQYMRIFINGKYVDTRLVSERWHQPGAIPIGPFSSIYPYLKFGQNNLIAVQLTGFMCRTKELNLIDPLQGRELSTMGRLWPGQFEQYCVVGQALSRPSWKVVSAITEKEGEQGEVKINMESEIPGLKAHVSYQWNAQQPIFTKSIRIINDSQQTFRIMNIRLGEYVTSMDVSDGEQGFPVYLGNHYFMSITHPSGWAKGMDGQVSLQQYPGKELGLGTFMDCMKTVYGTGNEAMDAREVFINHIRSSMRRIKRGHDTGISILESFGLWPGETWLDVDEKIILDHLQNVKKGQQEENCHFDYYAIEFWMNYKGDISDPDPIRFPKGFENIKKELQALNTHLGLWADNSLETLGIGGNPSVSSAWTYDAASYKLSDSNKWETFCRASEPYKTLFTNGFLHHIRENGLRLMKFDNLMSVCHNPDHHDHLPGIYSTEAIHNVIMDTLNQLDQENSDVFIMLYWGHRSPWWLLYADTLFESGLALEASSPASFPTLYARDGVTLCLDQAHAWCRDIPRLGKDSLGVWLSDWDWNSSIGSERWQEGVVMDMCRGSLLLQLWSDQQWLDDQGRKQTALFADLLKTYSRCFMNPRLILGDPWKNEPYGYCCIDGERAFIAINNCTWKDLTVDLQLNEAWGLPPCLNWQLIRWYPDPALLYIGNTDMSQKTGISLRPFEVVLLEAVPSDKHHIIDRQLKTVPIPLHFEESSRPVELVVEGPLLDQSSSIDGLNGKTFKITGTLPPCSQDGLLAVTAQIYRNGLLEKILNTGKYFFATASLEGCDVKVIPIIGNKTYPTPWQGWRIHISSSDTKKSFILLVTVLIQKDIDILFDGYFIPE